MPELKAAPPVLAFRHVTAHAPDGTTLLDDVSFSAARGSLVAIVGPTGAGKTSLARALTGSLPLAEGEMRVDGVTAFVPQHDTLHLGLSLALSLWYAATLRCPSLTGEERAGRVHSVMIELGLETHADTVVRDLSVGQRKRANVAAQLLGNPDVIVLDEPTAGLDPGYERVVLNLLRQLANAGRTVITVTHSVDTLKAADRVLFLAAGGSVAFFGPPAQAAKYFKLSDPADVFLALDTAPKQSWQDKFRSSPLYKRYAPADETAAGATGFVAPARVGPRRHQVGMLVRRHADLLRADRRHLSLLAVQAPIIGALLWAVLPPLGLVPTRHGGFGPHAAIVVMFVVLSTTWLGVTNAVREIVKERSIVKSEAGAGLSPAAYVIAKAISLGGITMAQSALIAFIGTARQGGPSHGLLLGSARFELVVIAALAGFAASALGLAISATAKSADKALAVLPMTLVLQLVLAGEWAQDARMPLISQVRSLVGARWGMEAMQGSLSGNGAQTWTALAAMSALAIGALALTGLRVAQATSPVRTRTRLQVSMPRLPRIPRVSTRLLAGFGTAAAVTMSLAAGGTGVMALAHGHGSAPKHLAAAVSDTTPTTAKPVAPIVVNTPETTPTTAAAQTPVTQPPVAKTRTTTVASTANDTPISSSVSIPVVPTPEIVTPTPAASGGSLLPSKPVATPASTTATTSPWSTWMKFFNPFAPASN